MKRLQKVTLIVNLAILVALIGCAIYAMIALEPDVPVYGRAFYVFFYAAPLWVLLNLIRYAVELTIYEARENNIKRLVLMVLDLILIVSIIAYMIFHFANYNGWAIGDGFWAAFVFMSDEGLKFLPITVLNLFFIIPPTERRRLCHDKEN